MALSFFSPSRCVLLLGDEGLSVYNVMGRSVKLVDSLPWDSDGLEKAVTGLIRKQCKGRSVLLLNDMTDQHFKGGQRLPNVGVMDRPGVLRRKLQIAFPSYPIRGALSMKKSKGRSADGEPRISGGVYLFAAMPLTASFGKVVESVKSSMASIAGLALLPVESSNMVKAISEKQSRGKKGASRWTIFMGQHQGGGLRQVIIRDGQLAMTRMTPVVDTDTEHDKWAQEVHQEFRATISYLSRFGFSPNDDVDVVVVAHPQAGEALEGLIDIPCRFTSYTVNQLAQFLRCPLGLQVSPRYADPLHVAWAGRKKRLTLPMVWDRLGKIDKARKTASLVILLLILGGAYLGWSLLAQSQAVLTSKKEVAVQEKTLKSAEALYQQEVKRLETFGFDVELVRGAIGAYDDFEKNRVKVLALVSRIAAGVGPDLRLDSLRLKEVPPSVPPDPYGGGQKKPPMEFEAMLKMSFPRSIDLEKGVEEVNAMEARLQKQLPEYEVAIKRNLVGLDYSAQFSGAAGIKAEEIAEEDYVAEIEIRGTVE